MIYNELLKKMKSNDIDSSYLFFGREEYLMNHTIEKLKNNFIKGTFEEINFTRIQGKEADLEDLINACETLPFMAEKKIVVLRDVAEFIVNMDKNNEKDLYEYLDNLGDFLCLILMDNTDSIKKNSKLYRYFNKKNMAVDFSKLVGRDLNNWIMNILKRHNRNMSIANINYFIDKSSYTSRNIDLSLFDLENELLKIIDYSKEKEITKDAIDSVLVENVDTNIFELLDAINRFDIGRAIDIFNDMYISNEPIQRIFYMITRQVRLLLSYKLYRQKGYNQNQIQEKLQIKNYEFKKISSQSSRWSIEKLENIMEELLNMDIKIKTTASNDKLLVEMLLVKLCNNK